MKPKPSFAEEAAAKFLRSRGWSVSEPACPVCHGLGYVTESWTDLAGPDSSYSTFNQTTKPCPDGCPAAMLFYSTTASGNTWPITVSW